MAAQDSVAASLVPVDRLTVHVLVDNVSDLLSTVPADVTPELPNLLAAGMTQPLSGECLCCAHWGLSLVITVERDGQRRSVLFDAGPEAYAVDRNGERLGIDFGTIDSVVLSHGHWDHAGGMLAAVKRIHSNNGGRAVPVHVNPGMFEPRAMRFPDGRMIPFRDVPATDALEAAGATVISDVAAQSLHDGMFYLSGEIPRVTAYEKGLPGHMKRGAGDGGDEWTPDPWITDERYLAVNLRDKGAVVFTACSHAGVANVLRDAAANFAPAPLFGVMGGFHLSGAACEAIIPETVADMATFGLRRIVAGHCTGWRAIHALVNAFGDEIVVPSAVGRRHEF